MLNKLSRPADQLVVLSDEQFDRLQRDELKRHFDANEIPFIERELTQLRQKAFEVKFPDSKARLFVPLATDIAPSAMQFSFKVYQPVGAAEVVNPKADVIPQLEVGAREITAKVLPVGISYSFTIMELREAARVGAPLETIKPRLARDTIERGIDELLCFGDLANTSGQDGLPVYGIANNADVEGLTIETFSFWGTGGVSGETMLNEMNALMTKVSTQSQGMFRANTLLIPLNRYDVANTKLVSPESVKTVLNAFRENNPGVDVQPWVKLNSAGASAKPRMIAMYKSAEVLEGVVPQEFEMMPVERKGFRMVTDCWATCGGVKVYQPTGVAYADGATAP